MLFLPYDITRTLDVFSSSANRSLSPPILPSAGVAYNLSFHGTFLSYLLLKKCLLSLLMVPGLLFASSNTPDDWLSLPLSQSLCGGHYATCDTLRSPSSLGQQPMIFSADKIVSHVGYTALQGEVHVEQQDNHFFADHMVLKGDLQKWQSLTASGEIDYLAPGLRLFGTHAQYDFLSRQFQACDVSYRWYARCARGEASNVWVEKDKTLLLKEATYTTCAPYQETWCVAAKQLILSPHTGRALASHLYFSVAGIPIFYLPYCNYPIDNKRHTGFLQPHIANTNQSGIEILIPFYWNIAPPYDMTLSLRALSQRGLEAQTHFRYLSPLGYGEWQWHFLPHDKKYRAFQEAQSKPLSLPPEDPRVVALGGGDNRYAFHYQHDFENAHWQWRVLFDRVSDDNYFVDLGESLATLSTLRLPQQATLSYWGTQWSHVFNIEEYQLLQPLSRPLTPTLYKRQPQWTFQYEQPSTDHGWAFGLSGEIVRFSHPDSEKPRGVRKHLRPSFQWPLSSKGFFLLPRVQWDWTMYTLTTPQNTLSRSLPLFDCAMGLHLERPLRGYTQTLEPELYYLFVPFRNQDNYPLFDTSCFHPTYAQLFRDNRFTSYDRIGDANQLTLALTSRLLSPEGQERSVFHIGKAFSFILPRVTLDLPCPRSRRTPLITEWTFSPSSQWSFGTFLAWNTFKKHVEETALQCHYAPDPHRHVYGYYYWARQALFQTPDFPPRLFKGHLHQVDFSFLWPLNLRWEVLGRWHYDLSQKHLIELLGGVEYHACCVAFQVVVSRYRQSQEAFYPTPYATGCFLQVIFKGLTPLGGKESLLRQKMPGYVPFKERYALKSMLPQRDCGIFPLSPQRVYYEDP